MQGNLQKDLEAAGFGDSTLSLGDDYNHDLINGVDENSKEDSDGTPDEHTRAMQEEDKAKMLAEMLKPVEEAKERLAKFISQQTGEGSEAIQQSLEELTRQISELIEKDHERLAQRAQVSDYLRLTSLPRPAPSQVLRRTKQSRTLWEEFHEDWSDVENMSGQSAESTSSPSTVLRFQSQSLMMTAQH
jgi:protein HOOK3